MATTPVVSAVAAGNSGASASASSLGCGVNAQANGANAVALGTNASTGASNNATAVGTTATATGDLATALGANSIGSGANSTVGFADQPVLRSISDANAVELAANYVGNSVAINPPPVVSMPVVGNKSLLSWPAWAGDFTLQAAGNLTPPIAWTNVPVTLQTNGDRIEITVPTPNQPVFFRLYHP